MSDDDLNDWLVATEEGHDAIRARLGDQSTLTLSRLYVSALTLVEALVNRAGLCRDLICDLRGVLLERLEPEPGGVLLRLPDGGLVVLINDEDRIDLFRVSALDK